MGCGRATLVHGLLLCTAVGGKGSLRERGGLDDGLCKALLGANPRALYHKRDNSPTAHVISYLDKLAVCIPTLEAWDQVVWPTMAAIPCTLTEAESYGYCQGQVVDLSPMMLAAQFQVTEEGGTDLCTARALVFEGSILTCNPTLNEAEWMPVCGLANDLFLAEERSAVALANYVPRTPVEVAQIARLGAGRIVSCPSNDSSTSAEEEEVWHSDTLNTNPLTDTDPEAGMRVRMGWVGRLALEMWWKETDCGTLTIGKP